MTVATPYQTETDVIPLGQIYSLISLPKQGKSTFAMSSPPGTIFLEVERGSFIAAWHNDHCRAWLKKRGRTEFPAGDIYPVPDWPSFHDTVEAVLFRPSVRPCDVVVVDHLTALSDALERHHDPYSQLDPRSAWGKIWRDWDWLLEGCQKRGYLLIAISQLVDRSTKIQDSVRDKKTNTKIALEITEDDLWISPDITGKARKRLLERCSANLQIQRIGKGASSQYVIHTEENAGVQNFHRFNFPPRLEDADMLQVLELSGAWSTEDGSAEVKKTKTQKTKKTTKKG